MSGYEYSDYLGGHENPEGQSGGQLRAQLEEALSEIKNLRSELNSERRGKTVETLLTEKGIDPAVAQLVPKDQDPKEWFDQYGHLFRSATPTVDQNDPPPTPEVVVAPPDPALEAERLAMQGVQEVTPTGMPSGATADVIQQLQSFQTEGELLDFIKAGGAGAFNP